MKFRRFAEENKKFFRYMRKRVLARALSAPIVETFGVIAMSLFIFYGGFRVIRGELTTGGFFMIMAGLAMCYQPVKGLNKSNQTIQEGMAGAARIFAILDTKPDIVDHPEAIELPSIKSGIEFKNVWFKYEEDWVLKNINLKVTVGDIIALVGPSGAGKTTLVNLLPRFYDIQEGQIFIDGQDIRKATIASLRDHIALVTQQTILFNDTVKYNISYGKAEKDEQKIIAAANAANAHHFIQNFPQGYDTIIGEQGVKLSGGEKQRITIARAILKNAPILILDEATSSLDSESELEVQNALENLMQNRTTFVIAHRLSTIKKANKIVVITNGEIVGEGTHEKLLKENLVYKKLYETQFLGYMSKPAEAIEPIPSEDKSTDVNYSCLSSPSFELIAMARKRLRPKVYTVGLKDYIAYFFERLFLAGFIFFTRFIPITYLYPVAARIGKIGAVLSPAYKQRVLGNLTLAFGKEKKIREKLAIYRESTVNTIKNYFEMLAAINALNKRYLNSAIQIEGRENLEASLKKGKGCHCHRGPLRKFQPRRNQNAGARFSISYGSAGDH